MAIHKKRSKFSYIRWGFFLLLVGVYQFLLYPSQVESLIKGAVGSTGAQLDLTVEESSLFFGFELRDISLRNPQDVPFFEAKRLKLSLSIPSILIGHIGIRELGLYDPKVYLIEKDGVWNYSSLSSAAEEPEKPANAEIPEIPETNKPKNVSTYFPIRLYSNIVIENCALHYETSRDDTSDTVDISGFSLRVSLISGEFTEVPLDLDIMNLFDTLILAINPSEPLRIAINGENKFQGDLRLSLLTYKETRGGKDEFLSRFVFDSDNLKLSREGVLPLPLGFALDYDTAYDQGQDRLHVRRFVLRGNQDDWLDLTAVVDRPMDSSRSMKIEIRRSRIRLGHLDRVLAMLSPGLKLGGDLSLAPITIEGDPGRMHMSGKIRAKSFYYKKGRMVYDVRDFSLDVEAEVDFYKIFPFLTKPPGYEASSKLVYGIFHRLYVPRLQGYYNGAYVKGELSAHPDTGVAGRLDVRNYIVDEWSAPWFTGFVSGEIRIRSPQNFSSMDYSGKLVVDQARYWFSGRSRSAAQYIDLNIAGNMNFKGGFRMDFSRLDMVIHDEEGFSTLDLSADGYMYFGGGRQEYDFQIDRLDVDYEKLHPTFPGNLRHTMSAYELYLSEGFYFTGSFLYKSRGRGKGQVIRTDALMAIPYLNINDLQLVADMDFGPEEISIPTLEIYALRGLLTCIVHGSMKKAKDGWDQDLDMQLRLVQRRLFKVHENIAFQGSVKLSAEVSGSEASGRLAIEGLNLVYSSGECDEPSDPSCRRWLVEELNLDLPVSHDLALKTPVRMSDYPDEYLSDNYGFRNSPNFTIRALASSHDPRGAFRPEDHVYIGTREEGGELGLSAFLEYRRNIFFIDWLHIAIFGQTEEGLARNGVIDGRKIFFNLADLDSRRMEYLPESKSDYDGIISADVNLMAVSLKDPLYNMDARVSVHRISPEFSGFATRILMPAETLAVIARSTLEIPFIQVELKSGLVYSQLSIRRGGLTGFLIRPSGEEIKQERIPLAQFLERARKEADSFTEEGNAQTIVN